MKRFLLLFTIISCLVSCSSDDDGAADPGDSLTGTWKLTAWNTQTAFDINNDGTASTNILDEINCLDNETITFNINNTAVVNNTSALDIEVFVDPDSSNGFVFEVDCESISDIINLSWDKNGNQVILLEEGFEDEPIVANLDGTTLTIIINDALEVYGSDFDVEFTEDFVIVYTKQ